MPNMAKELPPQELLNTITEIAKAAAEKDTLPTLADLITESVKNKFGFFNVNLLMLEDNDDDEILHGEMYSSGPSGNSSEEVQFPLEPSPTLNWIARNFQYRVIENLHEEMAFEQEHLAGAKAGAGFPLMIQSELRAILFVYTNREEGIPPSLISALELFSSIFSTILDNTEKAGQLQGGKETSSTLKQLSQDILLAKNETEVIKYLLSGLASSDFLTGIYSVEKDHLSVLGINDPNAPRARSSFEGIALPLHDIAEKLPQDDVLIIDDLSENLQFRNLASFYSRNEYQSAAMFTVYEIGQLSKIIVISAQAPQQLTQDDILIFSELIKSTRRSLSQFKEIKHLNQQLDELTTFQKVSAAVTSETNLDSLYKVLHLQIMDAIGGDVSFLVATVDDQKQMIQIPYHFTEGKRENVDPFPFGEGITSLLIKNLEPIMINENARLKFDKIGAKYIGEPSKSFLGVPLIVEDEAMGAIIVQDMIREHRFSENDLNLLTSISPHIALALRNVQTFTRMQEAIDALDQESYLLNALLASIPELVYFLDPQGKYTRVSQSYANLFGVSSPEHMIGQPVRQFLSSDGALPNPSLDLQALESKEPIIDAIDQQTDAYGKTHWSLNSRIPLIDQDQNLAGLLGLTQNINAMKEAEQLAQDRAERLEIASEIASEASTTLSVDEILNKAVNLIRDRFDYYHASFFQIDPLGEYAVLRDAAGEIGAEMLKIGHKLAVGSKSLVGQATGQRIPVVIEDVTQDPNYYPNPLLPETRAEMVVPVKLGDQLIGALDVQSKEANAFSSEVVGIMQILSDQLAIATSNALLFSGTQENLSKTRSLNEVSTLAASSATTEEALHSAVAGLHPVLNNADTAIFLMNENKQLEFRAAAGFDDVNFTVGKFTQEDGMIMKSLTSLEPVLLRSGEKAETISKNTRSAMLIPFQFAGDPMGVLCFESEEIAAFDQNDFELMVNFGNMLASIIYNNSLLSQVRRQAERQQALFDITNKVRQSVEMQSILQTSVTEICKAVGAQRARIELAPIQEPAAEGVKMADTSKEIQ